MADEARNIIELTSARLDRIEAQMAQIRESMAEMQAALDELIGPQRGSNTLRTISADDQR